MAAKKITFDVLKRFIKLTKITILGVEEDNSERTRTVKLTIQPIALVTGSNTTNTGAPVVAKDVSVIFVNNGTSGTLDEPEPGSDWDAVTDGITEKDGQLHYEGSVKLDVSRLKRINNNIVPPKVFLTCTAFNKRGTTLRNEGRNTLAEAVATIMGIGANAMTYDPTNPDHLAMVHGVPVGNQLNVVDTEA